MNTAEIEEMMREVAARVTRLLDRIKTNPAFEFNAVIHPSGVSGSGGGNRKDWDLLFSVQPWRRADGTIDHRKLLIRKPNVTKEELNSTMERLNHYEVVRLHAHVSDEMQGVDAWDDPQALLVTICEQGVDDQELRVFAAGLKKPKLFKDRNLGRLQLDRQVWWLEGIRRLGFRRYKVHIHLQKDGTYDSTLAHDKVLFVERSLERLKQTIIDSLFETYNACWESLGRLNQKQFIRRVRLNSVGVYTDGSVDVFFTDGGLFLEHEIEIRIDCDGRFSRANLAG